MSLKTLIEEHVTSVFLNTDHFAEQIVRYTGGIEAQASTITGIVTWKDDERSDSDRGRATVRRGEVMFSSGITVDMSDALKIGGVRCEIETVGPVQDGAFIVGIIRREAQTRGAAIQRNNG